MFFNCHKHFLGPDHVAQQATETEKMMQNSLYDGEKKGWDWDKYAALHKEQHMIMDSLLIMATVALMMTLKSVSNECLVKDDNRRPVNVFGFDPKARSKQAHKVGAAVASDECKMDQSFILLFNKAMDVKALYHHAVLHELCCDL